MGHTDRRVKLTSEVIAGIKAIKLYAWEEPYQERILAHREVSFLLHVTEPCLCILRLPMIAASLAPHTKSGTFVCTVCQLPTHMHSAVRSSTHTLLLLAG